MSGKVYLGREQSEAKHEILRRYLTPFANKILRTWSSLDFIDGFSGPWDNRDHDQLSDTSIGISLTTLSQVAQDLGHHPGAPRIRCIFNELSREPFERLQDFVARSAADFPLIDIQCFNGKFEDNAAAIKAAANHQFKLLFVDPKGYTGFPPEVLSMFQGRSTEIIVNVMRSFLERFVSGEHRDRERALIGLVGETRARYLMDTGLTIETLEAEYLSMLRGTLGYRYAGYSPIHNPDRDQIHFNLAYATNHPTGMEVMRSAEFRALSDHDKKRYEKKVDDGQGDLFGAISDELEIRGPYLAMRAEHKKRVYEVLHEILAGSPAAVEYDDLVARAQQELFLKRSEIGDEVVKMALNGVINSPWKDRQSRRPGRGDCITLI